MMMLAQPIQHRSDTHHSCWFAAGNAGTCLMLGDSRSLAWKMLLSGAQLNSSFPRAHQIRAAKRLPLSRQPQFLRSRITAKSP